jgi:hypothetical protein
LPSRSHSVPHRRDDVVAVETVCTTSTSFMIGAGLKKCMPDDVRGGR